MAYTAKEIWESLSSEEKEEYLNYDFPPDKEIYILYPEIRNRDKDIKEFLERIEKNKIYIDGFLSSIFCFFATIKKDFKRAAIYYKMISEDKRLEAYQTCIGDVVEYFPLELDEIGELLKELD